MSSRSWWRNCVLHEDAEIEAIDSMEGELSRVSKELTQIRELISSLELCHHKAERWVDNILEGIATGKTTKGLGTRAPGQMHPREEMSKQACSALSAWVAGCPVAAMDSSIGPVAASQLLGCLGKRTALKEWQIQRVIEKIRSWSDWPRTEKDPSTQYVWLSYGQQHCPEHYSEHEPFWQKTVETFPFEDLQGMDGKEFSLGLAIDMLWTCHWNFLENLQILLEVIGGNVRSGKTFAACAWNITLTPIRPRMQIISNSLRQYCGQSLPDKKIDNSIIQQLGEPTLEKLWLAASLDKTIRLQLDL